MQFRAAFIYQANLRNAALKRDQVKRALLRREQREVCTRERMCRSGLLVPARDLEVCPLSDRIKGREEENTPWKEALPRQTRYLPRWQPRQPRLTRCEAELDTVLDADPLFQQACAKLDGLDAGATSGEVLLRLLLVKYLYDWSDQHIVEQAEDSLVLRWFCRLGFQPAPAISSVRQAAGHVSVAEVEALANQVERAHERAQKSEGRLRPTYRQRWR